MIKLGTTFKNISPNTLYPNGKYMLCLAHDPETKELGIAIVNPDNEVYSHVIYQGQTLGMTKISGDEFSKVCGGMPEWFKEV